MKRIEGGAGIRLRSNSRNVGYGTRNWPLIKIIATSDHFKDEDGDLPIGARSIQKPYKLFASFTS